MDIDENWEDYQAWEKDTDHIAAMRERYTKATEKVPALLKFEGSLETALNQLSQDNGTPPL